MKKSILAAACLAVFGTGTVLAAPCASDSLSSYLSAGSCDLVAGGTVFHLDGFRVESQLPFGAQAIDPGAVSVTPFVGPGGLLFGLNQAAGPGELFSIRFGFSVSAAGLLGTRLELVNGAATDDGSITAIQGLCGDANYIGDPGICPAPATEMTAIATMFSDPSISDPVQTLNFPVQSFFDVFAEITLDGGTGGNGSAFLPGLSLSFQTARVPEPAVFGLTLIGLAAGAWSRRRRPSS